MFFSLMLVSLHGIMEVLVIGIVGFIIISGIKDGESTMNFLSKLLVRFTLPCLVFANLAGNFDPGEIELWWIPLLAISINVAGTLFSGAYVSLDRSVKNRGEFMALVAFQNGVFLPLAFAPVLFGPDKLPHFLNLIFLYNLLQIPTFFTLAVWLVHSDSTPRERLRGLINPPNVATVAGLAFALSGAGSHVPEWIIRPLSSIGALTPTCATLFVGGIIVTSIKKARQARLDEAIKATILKNLAFPALGALIVYIIRPPEYVALFIILESAMPSALMIALIAPPDKAKQRVVAAGILISSLAAILTIPLFMGFFGALYW